LSGVIVGVALAFWMPWQASLLAAFDASAFVFVAAAWIGVYRLDGEATRDKANGEDSSAAVVGTVVVLTCVVALVAELLGLVKAEQIDGGAKATVIVLSVLAAVVGWATVHTVYALHYARVYYDEDTRGIDFNGDDHPDYLDFAYFAITVGMTYQVSDTDISDRRIRRVVLRHALVSFLFGTVIIGTTINVMGGLIGR
jgi:uncharacterized membrane protein